MTSETQTSPEIIALILLAVAFTLGAWWLSDRQSRRFREFLSWIEDNYGARWQALPWAARRFNRIAGVEQLRRSELGSDTEFMIRYHQARAVRWPQIVALACGMAAIGLLAIGIEYFGWTW